LGPIWGINRVEFRIKRFGKLGGCRSLNWALPWGEPERRLWENPFWGGGLKHRVGGVGHNFQQNRGATHGFKKPPRGGIRGGEPHRKISRSNKGGGKPAQIIRGGTHIVRIYHPPGGPK